MINMKDSLLIYAEYSHGTKRVNTEFLTEVFVRKLCAEYSVAVCDDIYKVFGFGPREKLRGTN